MSDIKKRQFERTAAAGNADADAKARLYSERIRSGSLPPPMPRETECYGERPCLGCYQPRRSHDPNTIMNVIERGGQATLHETDCTGTLKDADCHVWEAGERECDPHSVTRISSGRTRLDKCSDCNGSGTLPYNPRDTLRLMAYMGDEAARLMEPKPPDGLGGFFVADWVPHDLESGLVTEREWTAGLLHIAALLPPLRLVGGVECESCGGTGDYYAHTKSKYPNGYTFPLTGDCAKCNGTGRKPYTVPFERWLSVVVGERVGRACLEKWDGCGCHEFDELYLGCERCEAPRKALDAAAAWIKCPCPALDTDIRLLIHERSGRPDWAWQALRMAYAWDGAGQAGLSVALTSAGSVIDPAAIRSAAQGALEEMIS